MLLKDMAVVPFYRKFIPQPCSFSPKLLVLNNTKSPNWGHSTTKWT